MRIFFLLPLFLASIVFPARSQSFWTSLDGPAGGSARVVGQTSGGWYIAEVFYDGAYRSSDGLTWEPCAAPAFPSDKLTYAVGPTGTLWAHSVNSFDEALFRSDDNGASWQTVQTSPALPSLGKLIELPDQTLYALSWGQINRSTDGGLTWQLVFSHTGIGHLGIIFINPYNGDFYRLGGTTAKQIQRSTDDGQTWTVVYTATSGGIYFDMAFSLNGRLLVAVDHQLLVSADDGQIWTGYSVEPGNLSGQLVDVDVAPGGRIFVVKRNRLWYSDDEAATWTQVTDSSLPLAEAIAATPDGRIFLARTAGSLYHSADNGVTWQYAASGMRDGRAEEWAFAPDGTTWVVNTDGVWRLPTGAASWQHVLHNAAGTYQSLALERGANGDLYAWHGLRLHFSSDGGTNWTDVTPPAGGTPDYFIGEDVAVYPNGAVFTTRDNVLFRSYDQGASWTDLGNLNINRLFIDPATGTLYCWGDFYNDNTPPQRSTDFGATWTPVSTGFPIQSLAAAPGGALYATSATTTQVIRSDDGGATWNVVGTVPNNNSGGGAGESLSVNAAGHLFLIYNGTKFLRSVDGGLSWNDLSDGLPAYGNVRSLALAPDQHLYGWIFGVGMLRSAVPTPDVTYLAGTIRADADADCLPDTPETLLPAKMVRASGPDVVYATSNAQGAFLLPVRQGTYTLDPFLPSPYWDGCSDVAAITPANLLDTAGPALVRIRPVVNCPYLRVDVGPAFLRRCFPGRISVQFANDGTAVAPGATLRVVLDTFLLVTGASLPFSQNGSELLFALGDLAVDASGRIDIDIVVSCDAALGQVHCYSAKAEPDALCLPDVADRTFDWECQPNVGAFDPNDKRAFVNGELADDDGALPAGAALDFMLRMQNTGTDTAFTVVIRDTLAPQFDITTVQPGASSHPYTFRIYGNRVLEFTFADIMLPDSNVNEPASHGFVKFSVDALDTLAPGTRLANRAGIYFDFNAPVLTNTVELVRDDVSKVTQASQLENVRLYPNPATEAFTLEFSTARTGWLELHDLTGRSVGRWSLNGRQWAVRTAGLAPGLYFYTVLENDRHVHTGRVVLSGR